MCYTGDAVFLDVYKRQAAGQRLTYSIKLYNNGPDPAQDALLTDFSPAELQGAEFSVDGGAVWQPWSGTLSLGEIASGGSAAVLLRGILDSSAVGAVSNTAAVSSPTYDPDLSLSLIHS